MIKLNFYRQIGKDQIMELLPVQTSLENCVPYFESSV